MKRHAQVVGAGLAGLTFATALAQRGWSVTVHERASELRMFGAGIWLWENGLLALGVIGARERTTVNARHIQEWAVIDQRGRDVFRRKFTADDHLTLPLRSDLYEALIQAARAADVNIVTNSHVTDATPEGMITLEHGETLQADVVVAADGAYSRIRERLALTERINYLREGYTRLVVEARPGDEEAIIYEAWNENRRFLFCPCSQTQHYVALTCPVDDPGRRVPVAKDTWASSFPSFAGIISRIGSDGRWDRGMTVHCTKWSEGRVVLVGDAAHAQAPNLGQGANISFTNAVSLAAALDGASDIPTALRAWERRERPLTDHVQRWSHGYGWAVSRWPQLFLGVRGPILQAVTAIPWVEAQLNRAARHRPVGSGGPTGEAAARLA